MNEKLEKNENKKTADVLRAENLVRDYVQYGEEGEKALLKSLILLMIFFGS